MGGYNLARQESPVREERSILVRQESPVGEGRSLVDAVLGSRTAMALPLALCSLALFGRTLFRGVFAHDFTIRPHEEGSNRYYGANNRTL